jgi:hypothetical protein
MENLQSLGEQMLIINNTLKSLVTTQQLIAQTLCGYIVLSGHKETFIDFIKQASTNMDNWSAQYIYNLGCTN